MGDSTSSSSSTEPSDIASSEVERYYTEPALSLTSKNPLAWWQTRAMQNNFVRIDEKNIVLTCYECSE